MGARRLEHTRRSRRRFGFVIIYLPTRNEIVRTRRARYCADTQRTVIPRSCSLRCVAFFQSAVSSFKFNPERVA